jgi:hypothetical protein
MRKPRKKKKKRKGRRVRMKRRGKFALAACRVRGGSSGPLKGEDGWEEREGKKRAVRTYPLTTDRKKSGGDVPVKRKEQQTERRTY